MDLSGLAAEIDRVLDAPDACADGETIVELHRQLERLTCATSQADRAFDESEEWAGLGCRSAASWLAWKCRTPRGNHVRLLRHARVTSRLSAFHAAWAAGEISAAHIGVVSPLLRAPTTEAALSAEAQLVEWARTLDFAGFCRAVDYWLQHHDPDGVEDDAADDFAARELCLAESIGGMWLGRMTFDPINGTIFASELERLERELYDLDVAEATQRLGRKPLVMELRRTPAQRRADAAVEMATRSASMPPDARRPRPLFTVLVGYETFHGRICELANRAVVPPGSLLPWLDQALIERVVFDAESRPIDVGRASRLFTGATRRAIQVRDLECFHDSCHVPAERCQIDHVIPYEHNGPTIIDNGRAACGFHNRLRHSRRPGYPRRT